MSTHLVTGKAGFEHVKASDHGALHAAIMGGGEFVLEGGEQFACQVISNNKVRIFDGEALMQGRHIRIDRNTYEETTHDNGVQGYKRIDLIVFTYTKDEGTGVEDVNVEVIKGTPSESSPAVPSYVTGDILNNGELKNQMPLYKIPFDGLSIGEPVKMFTTVPTLQTMKEEVDAKVDEKIAEMDDAFAELEAGIDEKIAEAGKPLSSNAADWGMIENYGEYSADAKTVGEEFAKVNDSLGGLQFGYDETTQKYGYWKKEADTEVFVPFSGSPKFYSQVAGGHHSSMSGMSIGNVAKGNYIVVTMYYGGRYMTYDGNTSYNFDTTNCLSTIVAGDTVRTSTYFIEVVNDNSTLTMNYRTYDWGGAIMVLLAM